MKKKGNVLVVFLIFGTLFLATSCLDSDECMQESFTPAAPFVLKVVDSLGVNLIDGDVYTPDSVILYYNDNIGIAIVQIYMQETNDGYVLISNELPITMLETENEAYYLFLNSTDTDTLNIKVAQQTDGCNIWHNYVDYKYNGELMEVDENAYIFLGVK